MESKLGRGTRIAIFNHESFGFLKSWRIFYKTIRPSLENIVYLYLASHDYQV